ncbi:hypothetical protein FRC14_000553 [Serendipita sp. 396]|nr:hypothetical protein FRC14_000553 [Serendipita sp. 396]
MGPYRTGEKKAFVSSPSERTVGDRNDRMQKNKLRQTGQGEMMIDTKKAGEGAPFFWCPSRSSLYLAIII